MTMKSVIVFTLLMVIKFASTAPSSETAQSKANSNIQDTNAEKDDLKTAASNVYPDRYSDWSRGYQSGYGNNYGVTGYGTIDDKYNYDGIAGYDNSVGYGGYDAGYPGYSSSGYTRGAGYGYSRGYGGSNYGNGGYGGYSGNGGLNSYYGYNNPYYQGAGHLGYGYYKRPGYGNIYSSGITPNLVTGYRGYSRK